MKPPSTSERKAIAAAFNRFKARHGIPAGWRRHQSIAKNHAANQPSNP